MRGGLLLGVLCATTAAAQVTFVGSNVGSLGTVLLPTATQPGDLLLVAVTIDNGQLDSYLWPADFRQVHAAAVDSPDGQSWAVGYGFATTGQLSVEVTNFAGAPMVAVAVYRGVDPLVPIVADLEEHSVDLGGSFGPWTLHAPALSAATGAMAVWVGGTDLRLGVNVPGFDGGATTSTTFSPPAGFTLRQQASHLYNSLALADLVVGASGSVGPLAAQASVRHVDLGNTVSFVVALRPSGGGVSPSGITFIGESSRSGSGAVTVLAPPGVQPGDTLLLSATFGETPGVTVTWPPGFTEFARFGGALPNPLTTAIATAVADGSQDALVVIGPGSITGLVTVLAYRGASGVGPFTSSSNSTLSSSPWTITPSRPVTLPDALLIEGLVLNLDSRDLARFTPSAGFVERHDQSVDRFAVAFADAPAGVGASLPPATAFEGSGIDGTVSSFVLSLLVGDGGVDAGVDDAGVDDVGVSDAAVSDAGVDDAGADDGDAGTGPQALRVGCGCTSQTPLPLAFFALLTLRRRREQTNSNHHSVCTL